jgi:hypothetical protein
MMKQAGLEFDKVGHNQDLTSLYEESLLIGKLGLTKLLILK